MISLSFNFICLSLSFLFPLLSFPSPFLSSAFSFPYCITSVPLTCFPILSILFISVIASPFFFPDLSLTILTFSFICNLSYYCQISAVSFDSKDPLLLDLVSYAIHAKFKLTMLQSRYSNQASYTCILFNQSCFAIVMQCS